MKTLRFRPANNTERQLAMLWGAAAVSAVILRPLWIVISPHLRSCTFRNITELLKSEGATWQDIVRTTCYLRDIERDYVDFNDVRNHFLSAQGLAPPPASTGIQARLCREDLLIEIEAIAILEREPGD